MRLMPFKEDLIEGGDQRTSFGPFVGTLTGQQTTA